MNYSEEYVEQMEKVIAGLREQLRAEKAENKHLTGNIEKYDEEIAAFREKNEQLIKRTDDLETENKQLLKRLNALREENEQLKASIAASKHTGSLAAKSSILTFYPLPAGEIFFKAEEGEGEKPKSFPAEDFQMDGTVLKKYIGKGGEVVIPDGVKRIDALAFFWCFRVMRVTFPESVKEIGNEAFAGCRAMTCVNIPRSVTSIGRGAFDGCLRLTLRVYPGSFGEEYAKKNCLRYELTASDSSSDLLSESKQKIAPTVKTRASYSVPASNDSFDIIVKDGEAVLKRYRLSGVDAVIPLGVTKIGDFSFQLCKQLMSVTIPETVTSIGDDAFWGCESLGNVSIPQSVISIGKNAFACCRLLKLICFSGTYGEEYAKKNNLRYELRK